MTARTIAAVVIASLMMVIAIGTGLAHGQNRFGPAHRAALQSRATQQQAADSLWQPQAVPPQCHAADVHLLLQDVSGSMKNLLTAALDQHARYVDGAPDCVYVIYGEFGVTARVIADGFLISREERTRITEEIRSRPQVQSYTNFDQAAELVELVLLKIDRMYTENSWSFTVSVISDWNAAPSEGHKRFDLQRYLTQTGLDRRAEVHQFDLVAKGPEPTAEEVRSTEGAVTAPVTSLSKVLQAVAASTNPRPLEPSGPTSSGGVTSVVPESAKPASDAWKFGVTTWAVIPAVVFVGLMVLVGLRRSGPPVPALDEAKNHVPAERLPRALRITENVVDKTGGITETLRHHQEVPVAVGVPVVFAPGASADIRLRPIPSVSAAHVVTIVPTKDGRLRIQGVKGLTFNGGEVVPRTGVVLDTASPVRLELADRRWQVAAVFEDATRADDLLTTPRTTLESDPEVTRGEVA